MIRGGWALLLGASLLTGCGLKGSLTLPEKPGEVKEKPGGCGCRLANTRNEPAGGLALGLLGLGLLAARRQRHS